MKADDFQLFKHYKGNVLRKVYYYEEICCKKGILDDCGE
jgi:hypothetical protein